MTVSDECYGYKVVRLQLREGSDSTHYVYIKEHRVRERVAEKPPDRTLFALGLPPYATEQSVKSLFSRFGPVEAVYFHSSPTAGVPEKSISNIFRDHPDIRGFKVGYIVYKNPMGLSNALSMDTSEPLVLTQDMPITLGIHKFCMEYNSRLVDGRVMSKEVNDYMKNYDAQVAEENQRLKQISEEPDQDGWVTVTKKGRKPGFSRKESVSKNIMKREESKKSKKQLLNFYRFQIRESKMNHLVKLREKFAEDKKKVALMKQSRKFRPF